VILRHVGDVSDLLFGWRRRAVKSLDFLDQWMGTLLRSDGVERIFPLLDHV
jgi:hypothetical protein